MISMTQRRWICFTFRRCQVRRRFEQRFLGGKRSSTWSETRRTAHRRQWKELDQDRAQIQIQRPMSARASRWEAESDRAHDRRWIADASLLCESGRIVFVLWAARDRRARLWRSY